MSKRGFLRRMFAGPAEGFTFRKTMQDLRHGQNVIEVGVLRDDRRQLLGDSAVHKRLLRAALQGAMLGLIGPNSRARSILRFGESTTSAFSALPLALVSRAVEDFRIPLASAHFLILLPKNSPPLSEWNGASHRHGF